MTSVELTLSCSSRQSSGSSQPRVAAAGARTGAAAGGGSSGADENALGGMGCARVRRGGAGWAAN